MDAILSVQKKAKVLKKAKKAEKEAAKAALASARRSIAFLLEEMPDDVPILELEEGIEPEYRGMDLVNNDTLVESTETELEDFRLLLEEGIEPDGVVSTPWSFLEGVSVLSDPDITEGDREDIQAFLRESGTV